MEQQSKLEPEVDQSLFPAMTKAKRPAMRLKIHELPRYVVGLIIFLVLGFMVVSFLSFYLYYEARRCRQELTRYRKFQEREYEYAQKLAEKVFQVSNGSHWKFLSLGDLLVRHGMRKPPSDSASSSKGPVASTGFQITLSDRGNWRFGGGTAFTAKDFYGLSFSDSVAGRIGYVDARQLIAEESKATGRKKTIPRVILRNILLQIAQQDRGWVDGGTSCTNGSLGGIGWLKHPAGTLVVAVYPHARDAGLYELRAVFRVWSGVERKGYTWSSSYAHYLKHTRRYFKP